MSPTALTTLPKRLFYSFSLEGEMLYVCMSIRNDDVLVSICLIWYGYIEPIIIVGLGTKSVWNPDGISFFRLPCLSIF